MYIEVLIENVMEFNLPWCRTRGTGKLWQWHGGEPPALLVKGALWLHTPSNVKAPARKPPLVLDNVSPITSLWTLGMGSTFTRYYWVDIATSIPWVWFFSRCDTLRSIANCWQFNGYWIVESEDLKPLNVLDPLKLKKQEKLTKRMCDWQ